MIFETLMPVAIVALLFVAFPAVILHYIVKWRSSKGLSSDDERMLEDLWHSAQRMEKRIETLETILDHEAPGWRARSGGSGERLSDDPPRQRGAA